MDKCYSMEWEETENGIEVRTEGALAGISRTPAVWYNILYRVAADGRLEIKVHADVSKNKNACYLPRFGFEFKVPYEMEEMEYFGRGPWENYQDLSIMRRSVCMLLMRHENISHMLNLRRQEIIRR